MYNDKKVSDTFRVNIRVATWINDWFDTKSNETGIPKSALMAMALNEYIDQKEGLKNMGRLDYFMNQLNDIRDAVNLKDEK